MDQSENCEEELIVLRKVMSEKYVQGKLTSSLEKIRNLIILNKEQR